MSIEGFLRIIILFIWMGCFTNIDLAAQDYPKFGPEKQVTINGLTFDAMEPFISPDGQYLFFNNLNDGIDTKLYYANFVNDSTFNFIGELNGTGQSEPPFLDAVADLDSQHNFYWTSTRDYPTQLDNLFYGKFDDGDVTDIGSVHGDFNRNTPGWLIMDHGISYDGEYLYANNARFDEVNCQGPCETHLAVAEKKNDSTFTTLSNSEELLQNINDSDYIYYAPCITRDNLELYYTRYRKAEITVDTEFEICVAIRNDPSEIFSSPAVLFSEKILNIIEAPTLTADQKTMYYHKKLDGVHKIMMRYREIITGFDRPNKKILNIIIQPNPVYKKAIISMDEPLSVSMTMRIISISGQIISVDHRLISTALEFDVSDFPKGLYVVQVFSEHGTIATGKIVVE